MKIIKKKNTKERFCGTCLAVPLAAGASTIASKSSGGSYRQEKNITMFVTIFIVLFSLAVGYYYTFMSDCKTCVV